MKHGGHVVEKGSMRRRCTRQVESRENGMIDTAFLDISILEIWNSKHRSTTVFCQGKCSQFSLFVLLQDGSSNAWIQQPNAAYDSLCWSSSWHRLQVHLESTSERGRLSCCLSQRFEACSKLVSCCTSCAITLGCPSLLWLFYLGF